MVPGAVSRVNGRKQLVTACLGCGAGAAKRFDAGRDRRGHHPSRVLCRMAERGLGGYDRQKRVPETDTLSRSIRRRWPAMTQEGRNTLYGIAAIAALLAVATLPAHAQQ